MWTRPWKTRGVVAKGTKGDMVHTHVSLSLSHHSCLFFWFTLIRSSLDEWGSPSVSLASEDGGCWGVWRKGRGPGGGGSPNSWTAKDRCWPRYESLIMVLTDKFLAETQWLFWSLHTRYHLCSFVCGAKVMLRPVTLRRLQSRHKLLKRQGCICLHHSEVDLAL